MGEGVLSALLAWYEWPVRRVVHTFLPSPGQLCVDEVEASWVLHGRDQELASPTGDPSPGFGG